ncbi:hypothetical protein [Roseicyclus mahoneyensis]|uniref:Uncharacterized protein n=1 Tax=Roseicyclus mahoneyensis TaxID=164332 RepID=A0A316GN28_9RHOB|nr:hypothetical protein [Roseicyclus mahoneyensis]PWK62570.1 hypothetical protein C7455_101598 [Roseicyclus mahoneyensis]
MTTVVSRLYDTVDTATRVADQLRAKGFPESTLSVITTPDAGLIAAARVGEAATAAYARAMKAGQALLVCRAPVTPFGAARVAMTVADSEAWIDAGRGKCNEYIREVADLDMQTPRILPKHPLMMTRDDYVGSGWAGWRMSDVFGFPTVSRRRDYKLSVMQGTRYMSRGFWPRPLLSAKPRPSRVISGGRLFLSSSRSVSTPHKSSVMSGHPRIFEKLGFRGLSARR